MSIDRRDHHRREEVIRSVVHHVVRNPDSVVTIENLKALLKISDEGVRRIVASLVSAGLMREVSSGVWRRALKVPPPGSPVKRRGPDA
jgi:hypothetical protein